MARAKQKRKSASKLPKGFTPISGGGSDSWPGANAKVGDSITVTVVEFKKISTKFDKKPKDFNVANCETPDGKKVTLWKSAGLAPIFDYEEGAEFFIRYTGLGKKQKGKNPARLYDLAVAE